MLIRVVFNQERNRPPETHEMAGIPAPSSIYTLNLDGQRYQVTNIVEYVPPVDVDAEIRVSHKR